MKGNPKILEVAHLGGKKTLERYGKEWFRKLGKKSGEARRKKSLKKLSTERLD